MTDTTHDPMCTQIKPDFPASECWDGHPAAIDEEATP